MLLTIENNAKMKTNTIQDETHELKSYRQNLGICLIVCLSSQKHFPSLLLKIQPNTSMLLFIPNTIISSNHPQFLLWTPKIYPNDTSITVQFTHKKKTNELRNRAWFTLMSLKGWNVKFIPEHEWIRREQRLRTGRCICRSRPNVRCWSGQMHDPWK